MTTRNVGGVAIGSANTSISRLLAWPGSIAWGAHWLLSTLDSGDDFAHYAGEMRAANGDRGDIRVVACGVLCDRRAVAALQGSTFAVSWFSQLLLFEGTPARMPDRLARRTTDGHDFDDPDADADVLMDLQTLGAYALLADGDWLNFATSNRLLVDEIRSAEARP